MEVMEGGIYVGYMMLCLRRVPTRQKRYSPIGRLEEKKKRNQETTFDIHGQNSSSFGSGLQE